jgi:predicted nucleic acid-binding protein
MLLVDTNIVFALFVQSTPWFAAVRELYGRDDDWRTESHGLVELSNVLSRYVRAKLLKPADALAVLALAEARLGPRAVTVAHRDALDLALKRKISAYDARFLRAAAMLGVPLVTEDSKLRKAAPELTCSLADALAAKPR